eukprot:364088-Chlamydomonas_euryale.AAC.12
MYVHIETLSVSLSLPVPCSESSAFGPALPRGSCQLPTTRLAFEHPINVAATPGFKAVWRR